MEDFGDFIELIKKSIDENRLVKISLSKPWVKGNDLTNVYVRLIDLKGQSTLSFTYRYNTNDQIKNFDIENGLKSLRNLMSESFKNTSLICTNEAYQLMTSKKGKISITKVKNLESIQKPVGHDLQKKKQITGNEQYLKLLGVADANGDIIPKMADKFRQINKYLEIVEGLISTTELPDKVQIVDMGSGKGYLTFALYDFLKNKQGLDITMTGVELREDLVHLCKQIAKDCDFENLVFCKSNISNYKQDQIDILIALHACDTATDDALSSGMAANAALIISAPCCHKQIRKQVKGKEQKNPLLQYGIFKERHFEMITDTLRALILEKNQYQSKIFEFVSNEHTRKNILLVGTKSSKSPNIERIDEKIEGIKSEYGIESHYLEEILS